MNQLKKEAREKLHVCAPPRLLTDKVASSGILRSPPRPLNRFRQAARGELGLTRSLERANIGATSKRDRAQSQLAWYMLFGHSWQAEPACAQQ